MSPMIPDCGVLTSPRNVPSLKLLEEGVKATALASLAQKSPRSTDFSFCTPSRSSEISGVTLSSGFSFGFYTSPKNTFSSCRRVEPLPSYKAMKRPRDGINKGVGHKIKKPKLKAKEKIKGRSSVKTVVKRLKEGKYTPHLPSNRSPVKFTSSGERKKRHVLSSPGISLLDIPEPDDSFLTPSRNGRFFTSRSRAAATVQIGKSIVLAARYGDVSLKQRAGTFVKKNVGRQVEQQLHQYLEWSSKSERMNEVLSLPSVQANPRPFPTRVPSSPSPTKRPTRRKISRTPSPQKSNKVNLDKKMNVAIDSVGEELQDLESVFKEMDKMDKLPTENRASVTNQILDDVPLRRSPRKLGHTASHGGSPYKLKQTESPRKSPRKMENKTSQKNLKGESTSTSTPIRPSTRPQGQSSSSIKKSPRKIKDTSSSAKNEMNERVVSSSKKSLSLNSTKESKFYSIFDPKRRQADQNISINKSNKCTRHSFVDKESSQMMIDAGQKKFGAEQCSLCGTVYEVGNPVDEASHNLHHDNFVNSVKFSGWKRERLVRDLDHLGGRVVMVSSEDPPHYWRKVEEMCEIVDAELGFSGKKPKSGEDIKAFLYILERRIVGCLIAERISNAYKIIPHALLKPGLSHPACCSETPSKVWAGVSRLWVLQSQRGKGIASTLVNSMRDNMITNYFLKVDEIAFSDPTENGLAFAEKYTGKADFLVYRRECLEVTK
nr:N-acetyltransferase ESCO2-like isoform X2 [Procambarus clarkii]